EPCRRNDVHVGNACLGYAQPPLAFLFRSGKVERHLSAGKQKDMFGSHLRGNPRGSTGLQDLGGGRRRAHSRVDSVRWGKSQTISGQFRPKEKRPEWAALQSW